MAASTSKNQRHTKRQITKLSNTCLWNDQDSFNWYTNQFLVLQVADQLRALAKLAPLLFPEQDCRGSLLQPLQPPHCNGKGTGVHSVLHSGVEQRSFARTVWPLGALPLPLSDVERKTRSKRTTHAIRAQSHWDSLWRLMHTAVAPWSCFHTCVLRLTRVRARPDARMSVSRVCIMFRVASHALFFSGSSLQAPSCERLPTLDCSCRSDLVVVDRSRGRLPFSPHGSFPLQWCP